ncbi:hypothetical protein MVEN_02211000 [Mycena venus]|uniref:Uncharacterized protein n=1 Tax=Mycena venus TaxID=2733690 RepID=A0A8H6X7S6_9AGAR|nr:hypothetical protein MVEN_02211000 [Mycena venus]
MVPAALHIQELWDHIIDLLYQSQNDLHSCSLACRAFVARAQSHAFCEIQIENRGQGNRLSAVLSSSPHLISYILHLYFKNCGPLSISPLNTVPWSHLDTITLQRHSFAPLYPHVIEELQVLVALPTIRRLRFRGPLWNPRDLFTIFSRRTTGLDQVDFDQCYLRALPAHMRDDLPVPRTHKPHVHHLELNGAVVGEALVDPACPLDVSGLTYVQSRSPIMHPENLDLNLRSRATITTLEFSQIENLNDFRTTVDLSVFPALRTIRLGEFCVKEHGTSEHPHPHPHIQMLARLPKNNGMTTLSLTLFGPRWVAGQEPRPAINVEALGHDLRALEDVLTRPGSMAALLTVEAQVEVDAADVAGLVRTSMPVLHARGIISVDLVDDGE